MAAFDTHTHRDTHIYMLRKKAVSPLLNRLNCSEMLLPSSHRSKPPLSKPIMESHSGDSLLIGESSSNSVSDVLQHFKNFSDHFVLLCGQAFNV